MWCVSRLRTARTGFFRSDPPPPNKSGIPVSENPYYFIDPQDPLFSTANEYRYTDDPTMRAPVLERSNVGMGMLLTNSGYMDTRFVNLMYRKVRDLEVNTLKRFTAVTSSDAQLPLDGINPRELLMVSEAIKLGHADSAIPFWTSILRNHADLAIVCADYYKPLIVLTNAKNSGIGFASLGNTSAAFSGSRMQFDFLRSGMIPSSGLSFTLAQTPWHIGEFLALTSRTVTGTNILYSGLGKRWISPEAFPFMEVTSEHKLEVSEKDANSLISEHFLDPPKDWVLKPFVPIINDVFSAESVLEMVKQLKKISANATDPSVAAFAKECYERILLASSPLALELTNMLVKKSRSHIKNAINSIVEEQGQETAQFIQSRRRLKQEHITKPSIILSVADEVRANVNLCQIPSLSENLFNSISGKSASEWNDDELEHVDDVAAACVSKPIPDEFSFHQRSDFTLSAHPKLRKFHPDFDYKTGLDHDPVYMEKEVERWSDHYQESTRDRLRSAVTGIPLDELKNHQHLFSW